MSVFESPLTDDCPLLPMRMHPAYRYGEMTPWGGDALGRLYGKPIPDPRTGEALEISCIPGLESADDVGETLPAHLAREGEAAGRQRTRQAVSPAIEITGRRQQPERAGTPK